MSTAIVFETTAIADALRRGEIVVVGHKMYALCHDCGAVVQINKRLFGSLHLCAYDRP